MEMAHTNFVTDLNCQRFPRICVVLVGTVFWIPI